MFSWGFRAIVGYLIGFVVVVWESFKARGQVRVLYSGHRNTTPVADLLFPGEERKKVKNGSIAPGLAPA
jgi:hypothetical protein